MSKIKDKLKKNCSKSGLYTVYDVRGITLTTLVITIIVILILASVATFSGIEAIENTKRTKFIAELKIMQTHVNQWYEDLKPSNTETKTFEEKISDYFTTAGATKVYENGSFTDTKAKSTFKSSKLQEIVNESDYPNFFLISTDTCKQNLGIEGVEQSVMVNVTTRKVVSYLGLKYKNEMYYTLEANDLNAVYNVGYENPNKGQPAFQVKSECTGPGVSKITVYDIDYNTGYNTKWKVYYKKDYDTNWQTSDDLSFVVTSDGVYTIKLTNQNGDIVGTTTTEIGAFAYKKQNSTLASSTDKNTMTSKNPVIPQGFKAVDTDTAKWKYTNSNYNEIQGWNDGLVIEDDIGNQFVWVPCTMGTSTDVVTYSKKFSYPSNYTVSDLNITDALDTTTIDGIKYNAIPVRENQQIFDYGGFYVARYEAGLPTETLEQSAILNNVYTSIPVSKYGSKIWNYIDYNHSYVVAEKMINNTSKYGKNKSGLITGKQWDTIMQWYEKNNIPVLKTNQNWGTYTNIPYSINGLYFTNNITNIWKTDNISRLANDSIHIFHASGLNNTGYKKNIADLGGNVWEWISEKYYNTSIFRASSANGATTSYPVSYRTNNNSLGATIGFRVVLYIQDEPQKEYVTDGLLAYYDAENNTGTGHSSTATTWKDLSGNNNDATLYGFNGNETSGWHSNYLAFDGIDDYVTGVLNSKGDITVEFIAKKNNSTNSTMFMINPWSPNGTKPSLQAWSTDDTKIVYRMLLNKNDTDSSIERSGFLGSSLIDNICCSVFTKESSNIKSYNNGSLLKTFTDKSFIDRYNFYDSDFTIGKWHINNSLYSNQNVYAMRVYNRALTEEEIRQNYEIDKVRFNIQE